MRTEGVPHERSQRAQAVHPSVCYRAPNPPAELSTKEVWLAVLRGIGSASWLCVSAWYPWRVAGRYGCADTIPTRLCWPDSDGVRAFTMARYLVKSSPVFRQCCRRDQVDRPPLGRIRAVHATAAAARRRSESVNSLRIRRDGILRKTR